MIRRIERPALKLATYINSAWPHYKADEDLMKQYGKLAAEAIKESREVMKQVQVEIDAFKKATQ